MLQTYRKPTATAADPQYRQLEADLAVDLATKRVEVLERAAAFEPIAAQLKQARIVPPTLQRLACQARDSSHGEATPIATHTADPVVEYAVRAASADVLVWWNAMDCVWWNAMDCGGRTLRRIASDCSITLCCIRKDFTVHVCVQAGLDALQLPPPLQNVAA